MKIEESLGDVLAGWNRHWCSKDWQEIEDWMIGFQKEGVEVREIDTTKVINTFISGSKRLKLLGLIP